MKTNLICENALTGISSIFIFISVVVFLYAIMFLTYGLRLRFQSIQSVRLLNDILKECRHLCEVLGTAYEAGLFDSYPLYRDGDVERVKLNESDMKVIFTLASTFTIATINVLYSHVLHESSELHVVSLRREFKSATSVKTFSALAMLYSLRYYTLVKESVISTVIPAQEFDSDNIIKSVLHRESNWVEV